MTLHMDTGPMAWQAEDKHAWMDRAACLGAPAWLFFPPSATSDLWDEALTICKRCPVVAECRDAVDAFERGRGVASVWGVWAGETPEMRVRRRRKERRSRHPVDMDDLPGSWSADHGGADPFAGECRQHHKRTRENTAFYIAWAGGVPRYVTRVCRVCKSRRDRASRRQTGGDAA